MQARQLIKYCNLQTSVQEFDSRHKKSFEHQDGLVDCVLVYLHNLFFSVRYAG